MNILTAVRQSWWLALAVAAIAMAIAMLILTVAPKSYTASAVVAVVPNEDTSPSGELVRLAVPTYASLATSQALATSMADSYGEDRSRLTSAIDAQVAPSTNTVVVSVRWSEPERAAELTNGVVDQLIEFSSRDPILTAFVVAPAVPPAVATFPPPRLSLVAAAIASVGLGVAAAWAHQAVSRRRVTTPARAGNDGAETEADAFKVTDTASTG